MLSFNTGYSNCNINTLLCLGKLQQVKPLTSKLGEKRAKITLHEVHIYRKIQVFFVTKQVCSNKNLTFDSECHMDREACWCRKRKPQCGNPSFRTLRLDYYGECKRKRRKHIRNS